MVIFVFFLFFFLNLKHCGGIALQNLVCEVKGLNPSGTRL